MSGGHIARLTRRCPLCEVANGAPHIITASRAGGVALFVHVDGDEVVVEGGPEDGARMAAGLLDSCANAWRKDGKAVPADVEHAVLVLRARIVDDMPKDAAPSSSGAPS